MSDYKCRICGDKFDPDPDYEEMFQFGFIDKPDLCDRCAEGVSPEFIGDIGIDSNFYPTLNHKWENNACIRCGCEREKHSFGYIYSRSTIVTCKANSLPCID